MLFGVSLIVSLAVAAIDADASCHNFGVGSLGVRGILRFSPLLVTTIWFIAVLWVWKTIFGGSRRSGAKVGWSFLSVLSFLFGAIALFSLWTLMMLGNVWLNAFVLGPSEAIFLVALVLFLLILVLVTFVPRVSIPGTRALGKLAEDALRNTLLSGMLVSVVAWTLVARAFNPEIQATPRWVAESCPGPTAFDYLRSCLDSIPALIALAATVATCNFVIRRYAKGTN